MIMLSVLPGSPNTVFPTVTLALGAKNYLVWFYKKIVILVKTNPHTTLTLHTNKLCLINIKGHVVQDPSGLSKLLYLMFSEEEQAGNTS